MTSPQTPTVLLATSDAILANGMQQCLRAVMGADVRIVRSRSAAEALAELAHEWFPVIIVDHFLTDSQGTKLMRTLVTYPGRRDALFLIGHDGLPDPITVRLLREYPVVRFVRRPLDPTELAGRVREALMPANRKELTFFGLRVSELVQAFCFSQRTLTIMVLTSEGHLGTISIREGQLIDAEFEGKTGLDALTAILRCQRGELRVERSCVTARHSISMPAQRALIEAYRKIDEGGTVIPLEADLTADELMQADWLAGEAEAFTKAAAAETHAGPTKFLMEELQAPTPLPVPGGGPRDLPNPPTPPQYSPADTAKSAAIAKSLLDDILSRDSDAPVSASARKAKKKSS